VSSAPSGVPLAIAIAFIVVGVDGSGCADCALAGAIELAKDLGDEILITYGYEPGGLGEEHAAHRDAVKQVGEQVTNRAMKRAKDAGVQAKVALIPERPATRCCRWGRSTTRA
jgi:nucleotide-binding universal stress UspA family protein